MQFLNRKPQHSIVVRIVFFSVLSPCASFGLIFFHPHDFPFIVSCRGVLTMFYLFCCAFFCCCFAFRRYVWKPLKTRVCLTKLDFRQKWVCDFMVFSPSTTRSMPCHDCAHLISNQFSILAFNYEIQITTQSRRCAAGSWPLTGGNVWWGRATAMRREIKGTFAPTDYFKIYLPFISVF